MKTWLRLIFFAGFALHGLYAPAQVFDEDTSHQGAFIKPRRVDSKCYAGFEGNISQFMKTRAAMSVGASLNWVLNHQFVVSAKYRILTSPVNVQGIVAADQPGTNISLTNQYAGLGFSYIVFYNKTFSLQPEISGGWADVRYKVVHASYLRSFGEVVPAIYGVYNCTKNFRFGIGLNYQASLGCHSNGLTDAHLSGIGGVLFMHVGTF